MLWREIVASALELPLETTTAEEGSAYGAALLAGCRAGVFAGPRESAERCVRIAERREPNPEWTAVYREGYERYRCLYPALHGGRP